MEQVLLTPKEASLLAAIESDSEFSFSQAAIWANMGPTEVRDLLNGLQTRGFLVRNPGGERYSFTKAGLQAKRQLSKGYDKNFWISDEGTTLDSARVEADLGNAIDRLNNS